MLRLAVAAALVACLVAERRASRLRAAWRVGAGVCAALFLVSVAGCGHATAQSGAARLAHLAADGIHLLAAGAWIGALPPFVAFLGECLRDAGPRGVAAASGAANRFSFLGMASSGAIVLSGLVNATFTVGHVAVLTGSDYGRLLLAKVALFAVILVVAAVNRVVLTPRIAHATDYTGQVRAVRQLRRNALLEMALAFIIVAIVGRLGITMPAMGPS
jgi:copper resistance protein D